MDDQDMKLEDNSKTVETIRLIKKQLRGYRRQLKKNRKEQLSLENTLEELNLSIFKAFDDKTKARLRCKALTAHARFEQLLAHETRLTRYINELEKERILIEK